MKKLLAPLLFLPCLVWAFDFEASLGVTQFAYAHDCSTWYQCPFDHTLNLTSPSVGLGVSDKIGDFRWHVGYEYLGRVTSHALATTGPDFNYNFPKAHFNGSGYVHGLYASAEYEWVGAGVTWGVGPGIYIYKPHWQVDIPDWQGCFTCAITPTHVTHNPRWQSTPTLDLTAHKDQQAVVLTYYHHITADGDQWPALYDINHTSFLGKAGFPGTFNLSYRYTW